MGWYDQAIADKQNYLNHHGILGQKWGVRRYQNKDGSLTAAGKSRLVSKTNKAHNFQDHSKSKSTRGGMVASVLSAYGITAVSAIANVASISSGYVIPSLALLTPVSAIASVGGTAALISGDVSAHKANKKEKQFAEERAQNPIDKKTGFHKKTREMTADEDMERVNPAFKNWDENTKNNCVLCTMSMELRRRGYDVQARKATEGYDGDELVKDWFHGAKPKEAKGSMSDQEVLDKWINQDLRPMDAKRQKQMIDDAIDTIANQKDGARGQISMIWDRSAAGHSVAYANEGGKVVIYDAQSNEKYEGDKAREYLGKTQQIRVTRLDNCDINLKYIKEVAT